MLSGRSNDKLHQIVFGKRDLSKQYAIRIRIKKVYCKTIYSGQMIDVIDVIDIHVQSFTTI